MKKKNYATMMVTMMVAALLTGCSATAKEEIPTCADASCSETELYKDGYCKYHYEKNLAGAVMNELEEGLKGLINGD